MLAVLEVIPAFCLWASEVTARVLAVLMSGIWAPVDSIPNLLGNHVKKCLTASFRNEQQTAGKVRNCTSHRNVSLFYKDCIEDCW